MPRANAPKKAIPGLRVDGIHRLHEAIDLIG